MGVLENEDLYDDLYTYKEDIQILKNEGNVFRSVNTEKKANKPQKIVLFVKNYEGDVVDRKELEKYSSDFLREHWRNTEDFSYVKKNRSSGLENFTKKQKGAIFDKNGKRKGKEREFKERERPVDKWENVHLRFKIEKALKQIKDITVVQNKTGFKKVKKEG